MIQLFQSYNFGKVAKAGKFSDQFFKIDIMTAPTRLFDCIEYQLGKYPKEDMIAAKEGGVASAPARA